MKSLLDIVRYKPKQRNIKSGRYKANCLENNSLSFCYKVDLCGVKDQTNSNLHSQREKPEHT